MRLNEFEMETRIRDIVRRYGDMFIGRTVEDELWRIPPGWLPVLHWALERLVKSRRRIRVAGLEVKAERLYAVFAPNGDSRAERLFQALLADSRDFCPACGRHLDM